LTSIHTWPEEDLGENSSDDDALSFAKLAERQQRNKEAREERERQARKEEEREAWERAEREAREQAEREAQEAERRAAEERRRAKGKVSSMPSRLTVLGNMTYPFYLSIGPRRMEMPAGACQCAAVVWRRGWPACGQIEQVHARPAAGPRFAAIVVGLLSGLGRCQGPRRSRGWRCRFLGLRNRHQRWQGSRRWWEP